MKMPFFVSFFPMMKYVLSFTVGVVCAMLLVSIQNIPRTLTTSSSEIVNQTSHGWQEGRKYRFPSVEERVKLYMSNWYLPPCDPIHDAIQYEEHENASFYTMSEIKLEQSTPRHLKVGKKVIVDRIFAATKKELDDCVEQHANLDFYCSDPLWSIYDKGLYVDQNKSYPPLLFQFGDHPKCQGNDIRGKGVKIPSIPVFRKIRRALSREELERVTTTTDNSKCVSVYTTPKSVLGHQDLQPIIWLLATFRHYDSLENVTRVDRPWSEKKNAAIFRGTWTGQPQHIEGRDATEICRSTPRCRLVLQTAYSKLVDAKLTKTRGIVPEVLHGINLVSPPVSQGEVLAYKGCIVLEGNDVASGLKWMLLSQSVVLMPPPTFTSWAMEEFLEPWVHYIPLEPDLSDVEEKVQWMIDHDEESQRIAHRGTLWMVDLLFHPEARRDNELINREILRRYFAHFHARI